jgi:hypothetical protein
VQNLDLGHGHNERAQITQTSIALPKRLFPNPFRFMKLQACRLYWFFCHSDRACS